MARLRTIKPEFFQNEQLADLPMETRLLFIGLWTMADRRGILEDRPKRIKATLFPYDNIDVVVALDALADAGLISRYQSNGVRGIFILKFSEHQNPHVNERANDVPEPESTVQAPDQAEVIRTVAPDEHQSSTVQAPEQHSASTVLASPLSVKGMVNGNGNGHRGVGVAHARAREGEFGVPADFMPPDPPTTGRNLPRCPLPDNWEPDEFTRLTAHNVGLSNDQVAVSLDKFRGHARSNGLLKADWQEAARMWLKDEPKRQTVGAAHTPVAIRDNVIKSDDFELF